MKLPTLLSEPGGRAAALIVLLLAAVLPAYVWHENTSGFLTDDGMHLMLADFFSPYYDANFFVEHFVISQSRFPPGFPLLIGLLGGGSRNMAVAHLVTAGCFVLSAALLFLWARGALHASITALACLATYVLLPGSLVYVVELRSEFLYMALVFAALLLLEAAPRPGRGQRELLVAASFTVGLCLLTRTIGVALFGAFLVHLYLNKAPRKALYTATAAALPLAWLVIKTVNGYSGSYVEDLYQYLNPAGAFKLLAQDVPRNAVLIFESWQKHLAAGPGSSWLRQCASIALLVLGLVGAVDRVRRKAVDVFYVLLYLPPILIWPHALHVPRLIYPLVPFLLVYVFIGARIAAASIVGTHPVGGSRRRAANRREPGTVMRTARGASWLQILAAAGLLALVVPPAVSIAQRATTPVPADLSEDFRHTRPWLTQPDLETVARNLKSKMQVIDLLQRVPGHLALQECMYAVHPVSVMLYSNRRAELVSAEPVPAEMTRCDYLFVMNLIGQYDARFPLDRIDRNHLTLIDIERSRNGQGQAYLFRIKR